MKDLKRILVLAGVAAVVCVLLPVWLLLRQKSAPPMRPDAAGTGGSATFVGRAACAACHQNEEAAWRGSHHDLAMQPANFETVRGDFGDATFDYHGVTTTFSRRGEEFRVRTDGADGELHEYRVAYTFGVDPLQQYLIEFPNGRYQALNVCWDTRPREQGGQRWFHLYPNENITHDDILHWTGPYQNWNHMCAECHSTNVHKNYDAARDRYATSWSEINVACEACHGPGSEHVAWAQRVSAGSAKSAQGNMGLVAPLRESKPAIWQMDPATGIAKRDTVRTSHAELETCARCHSRRGTFNEDVLPGRPPADTHRLALLEASLYEHDGQIKDEVYEYGSFLQSRMHAAGVTCSDCHNPHSLKTASGNTVCARCHAPERFDTRDHHFHAAGTAGSACVDCHMPTRNYMVVHARHDHSLRVPRPDLTVSIGTPNACNGCHADQTPQWAADEIARRTPGKSRRSHFGEALAAARNCVPGADALLCQLLADGSQPAIARATAADMLEGSACLDVMAKALRDGDPIVRAAAAGAIHAEEPEKLIRWLSPLLRDPVRQVRIDAGRRLAAVPEALLTNEQRAARDGAIGEFIAAQHLDADRAEARLNLGALYAERGDFAAAEGEYLAAIRLSPRFPATYVNLGDLYRQQGRDADALRVLQQGLTSAPGGADIPHALGLALVRTGRVQEALPLLERASTLAPHVARYAYVYGVALETVGPAGRGIETLQRASERCPSDSDILGALVAYCRGANRLADAVEYAGRLAALHPDDVEAREMLKVLQAELTRSRDADRSPAPAERSANR